MLLLVGRAGSSATMFVGNVVDCFQIAERGLALLLAVDVDSSFVLKVGDQIEIRTSNERISAKVRGVEIGISDPVGDKYLYGVLLPIEVDPKEVPRGAEIWTIDSEASHRQ